VYLFSLSRSTTDVGEGKHRRCPARRQARREALTESCAAVGAGVVLHNGGESRGKWVKEKRKEEERRRDDMWAYLLGVY
jgi:hypothetical protein